MHTLLSPGIHLLGRFGFARKFQVLFFLFMLPLAGSLWMIGSDYRGKLNVITSEQSGVHQLLALDTLDGQLTAQRNLAARWKALDILHAPTPAAQAAMDNVDAGNPMIMHSLQRPLPRPSRETPRPPKGQPMGPKAFSCVFFSAYSFICIVPFFL